ncbi:MAG: hypothetical protein MUO82_10045 [Candidatus Thermoplasmatota archaeon]|nr:hypothetical protein [Candidatus Thermoplasmatota archaeon]
MILSISILLITTIITPIVISEEKERIINSELTSNDSNHNSEPKDWYISSFLTEINITFDGNITHFGSLWTNIGIRLSWKTDRPVNITFTQKGKTPKSETFENGCYIVTWIFRGNDGIKMPYQEENGTVNGHVLLFNVYT